MVKPEEILSMEYLKKSDFTGSTEGMRYRLEKSGDALLCTIWPEPFNYHTTPESEKETAEFTFDRDGVEDAVRWMNDRLFAEHDRFSKAPSKWNDYKLSD